MTKHNTRLWKMLSGTTGLFVIWSCAVTCFAGEPRLLGERRDLTERVIDRGGLGVDKSLPGAPDRSFDRGGSRDVYDRTAERTFGDARREVLQNIDARSQELGERIDRLSTKHEHQLTVSEKLGCYTKATLSATPSCLATMTPCGTAIPKAAVAIPTCLKGKIDSCFTQLNDLKLDGVACVAGVGACHKRLSTSIDTCMPSARRR